METTSKTRTPSRCREWERQRRNKFNDAITKLGEAVQAINKANDPSGKDSDNIQYPKIEIIQKAIICLTNCAQEKTQLKAEILALQVKIEASKQSPESKKDASTQVHTGFSKKPQNGKYVKLLMLQKSKRNALKEKSVLSTNVTVEEKSKKGKVKTDKVIPHTPPKILPKSTLMNKKRAENTIVVLPAAPYLFPQRPLFLPAVPPAFVIVDPNMQTINKTVPIVNRTVADTTKTTMVNILPISAYSRPLSATKAKKNNSKSKSDVSKKIKKKLNVTKTAKDPVNNGQTNNTATDTPNLKTNENSSVEEQKEVLAASTENKCLKDPISKVQPLNNINDIANTQEKKEDDTNTTKANETTSSSKVEETAKTSTLKTLEKVGLNESEKSVPQPVQTNRNEVLKEVNISIKSTPVEDKDKENKLPNILDTSLCESGVDGGNARLELAEEFLAASPTAAFLMSFPLVSGNRADSPAEEVANTVHPIVKENSTPITVPPAPTDIYFEKSSTTHDLKTKTMHKEPAPTAISEKQPAQHKYLDNSVISKSATVKTSTSVAVSSISSENPFLSLPMPSLLITTTQSDTFGLDFDCSISKSIPSQSSAYVTNSSLFYKSDPFNTVKSTIYSTSSIASGHEFNGLGLYPCAMEKYSKNKSDFPNVEDNLMKIGSSRLTYDIDLGWSHKGFDFVNCTTNSNTFSKDILTTATAPTYSSSYNPFNPEFHVPLVSTSSKKDTSSKPISSFADTITSFYSTPQPANLWSEEMCFYNNSSASKTLANKHQNYLHLEHAQTNTSIKPAVTKQYETKTIPDPSLHNIVKPPNETIRQQLPEKYSKKSPNKMHINWMTSEPRPMQSNCNPPPTEMKETHKQPYSQIEHSSKKQEQHEGNYFPITMHNFSAQPAQEDFQVWPSARPLGTTEISIEPPPINLPTLVGDLALGPHDKKKNADLSNRIGVQPDIQNCGNFLSVTQLMNRSSDHVTSRYGPTADTPKSGPVKHNNAQFVNDVNRKPMTSRLETNLPQPCYVFNDLKHSYENMGHFAQPKPKTNKSDKNTKVQKHSYSAEALIRSGNCTQKVQDHIASKFMPSSQKYADFNNPQDTSVAQVSHFPPILDYSDNSYTGQQFSGTTLYNSTTNTISNSFYSNFMSGSANIMSGSYTTAPFTGDFMDYNQAECNYPNNKYEEFKMRGNPTVFQEKVPSNYKSSRRESGTKHKLECSKKESSKKYQNKRAKVTSEAEEWSDANLFWQNKGQSKKHPNMLSEEFPFANYVGNGMAPQYQHELFNSHLVSGVQPAVGDRSLAAFPATSRANFNLSTIFPEITMKVQ